MEVNLIKTAAFAVQDKSLITVNLADVEKSAKERREFFEKANPPKPEPAQVELNKLRSQLFSLQQAVKNTEIYANNKAGEVELLEQRLAEALKKKNEYGGAGNLLAERACEHSVQRLEGELVDAKKEYTIAKHRSAQATRALRTFDGAARIIELKAQLEPKPITAK